MEYIQSIRIYLVFLFLFQALTMKSWPVLGITMMITVAMVTGDIQEDNGATSLSRLGILLEAQRLLQTCKYISGHSLCMHRHGLHVLHRPI